MVAQTFVVLDSESLAIAAGSPFGTAGNPIINNSDTPDGTIFTYSEGSGVWVTLDDTGGNADTFEDDQSGLHTITDGAGLVTNGNGVEAESIIEIRALDGLGNPTGPTITLTVFSQNGAVSDVWGYSTDTPLVDGVSYEKITGSNLGTSNYADFITCFGPGTLIETDNGSKRVEDISVGDMVWTKDAGPQPVGWVGRKTVRGIGAFAPVVISAGTLGNAKELVVSQEHRMFFSGGLAEYLFGEPDVLVAAKHLCALPGVAIAPRPAIEYTHVMFDRHHILRSNGMLSESFFLSENSVSSLDLDAHNELVSLFPFFQSAPTTFGKSAALSLKKYEAEVWCEYLAA
ncbi:MAG: Hint domain-containing protein [Tateyamaria sp.]|uniref:Hint domain-containing protein n=1 Tax=Tateyamaria sp. TaxID=1929288 RepID=UPI00329B1578